MIKIVKVFQQESFTVEVIKGAKGEEREDLLYSKDLRNTSLSKRVT